MMALLVTGILAAAQLSPGWDDSWTHCTGNGQCVIVKDECENFVAVNSTYLVEVKEYYDFERPTAMCLTPPPAIEPTPYCIKGVCNAQ